METKMSAPATTTGISDEVRHHTTIEIHDHRNEGHTR